MQAPYSSIWPQAWRHFLSIEFGLPVRRLTSTPPSKPPSHRTENSLGNQWRHNTHLNPESLLQSPSLHVFVLITHDVYTFVSVTSLRQVKARSWVGQIHCKARCSRTTRRWVTVTPILFHLTWSTRLPSLSVRRRVGCYLYFAHLNCFDALKIHTQCKDPKITKIIEFESIQDVWCCLCVRVRYNLRALTRLCLRHEFTHSQDGANPSR